MQMEQVLYLAALSGSTVTLSPIAGLDTQGQAGLGIASVVVTTTESTAGAGFWGSVANCSRFLVRILRTE